jgi:hypothetical protein
MQDPFVGTWKLNAERSEFDANHRPTAGMMVFELDERGHYLMTAEGLNAKGGRKSPNGQPGSSRTARSIRFPISPVSRPLRQGSI